MTAATILIPTHRHAAFLPCAIRSALAQVSVTVEVVFVVGDGVDDDTRKAMQQFNEDPRVRFFDFPKGERHGESHRHIALQEARGELVCYLSDDLLLPWHVIEMTELLAEADLAHSTPVRVLPDGILQYRPADIARPEFLALIRQGRNNFIGLTGAAHTRAAYDRLPHGWRPAPAGKATEIHMWQQICALPGFRGATARRLTTIHLECGRRGLSRGRTRRMAGPCAGRRRRGRAGESAR